MSEEKDLTPVAARLPRGERVTGVAECADCGAVVEVDSGEDPFAPLARHLAAWVDGVADGWCENCAAARDAEAEEQAALEERKQRQLQYRRLAQVPAKYRVSFADVDGKSDAVVRAARDWADGNIGGLVLLGDVGRGKTFLAGAAVNDRTWYGPVRWLSTPQLLAGLRAGYGTDEQRRAAQALTPVRNLALVLDDFDKARPAATALETLFLAVDRWVAQEYPLLLTMNRDLDRIREDWPEEFATPIASRLAGYCQIVRVKGPDRRIER